ncbi:hypothetical protein KZZ52_39135 [Dactylosporangium sp. AC04546]|uniref:hypothetical protein n=1 Tax=Dactylosporangium sp. AC04546 TaxID=2862460 RepID=UPI001EE00543|nr:hypothetical protein [Dactylosporangium sp. AC04546]WVK79965.1 hypothetical protein KZZ52_39135 [Dactylosporangium sp. AC04546]
MPTDPTRELLRRAYHADGDVDVTAGLLDVLRRADPPLIEMRVDPPVPPGPAPRRVPVFAVAAAILVVLVGMAFALRAAGGGGAQPASSRGATASGEATADATGAPDRSPAAPRPMPSQCASAWQLGLRGTTFDVGLRKGANCPALAAATLFLVDVAEGNGRFEQGFATVWPITPVPSAAGATVPFSFTAAGWPGAVTGHTYLLWCVEDGATVEPGDDAMVIYDRAKVVTTPLLY